MFFVLSKIVYWLVMPISLIVWVGLASTLVKSVKLKKILRRTTIGFFLFFTNPMISTLIINAWEPAYERYDEIEDTYQYGIVLSGITNPNRPPFDRIQFNKGADRIVHAIDLYKRGIVKKLIITGGSGVLTFDGKKESHQLMNFAIQSGVPSDDIILEDQARNTHENALYSSRLISSHDPGRILVITSAFHMYRAQGCFEKLVLEVDTFPTDHYGRELFFTPDDILIPSLYALNIWTILTKEWLGILAYKMNGYI
ncbi:MAG: YdcF family protein [Reichenbachiella sp.]|uniref:YdcF family protein n=1 Tax=Reichenbachiella sp. TaxID=2184521 RepID=UPI003263D596